MKRTLSIGTLICVVLALPVWAQEEAASEDTSAQAREILEKADEAARAVGSVSIECVSEPTGIALRFISPAEGRAVMSGWAGSLPQKFFIHIKTSKQGSDEPLEVTGGGDGDTYFVIDHGEKKGYEDMDPGVMGSYANTLQNFGMQQFVSEDPYERDLGAEKLEFLGEEAVDGEDCYKVNVTYGGRQGTATWLFSKNDYLPRRRIRHFDIPQQGKGTLETTITKMVLDPALDASMFKMKLPDGYEQIDDFAP